MKQKATFFKRALLSLIALLSISAGAKAQDMLSTPLTLEATSDGDITFSVTYSYTHEVVLTPRGVQGQRWQLDNLLLLACRCR